MKIQNSQSGFTLIELLVVVSILGFMASVLLVNMSDARKKSRDTVRKQTMKQLQTALELFYEDNGRYPTSTTGAITDYHASENIVWVGAGAAPTWVYNEPDNYIPGLAPKYIRSLPRDPFSTKITRCTDWRATYMYRSDGKDYKLLSWCSGEISYSDRDTFNDPARDNYPLSTCSGGTANTSAIYSWAIWSSENSRCW